MRANNDVLLLTWSVLSKEDPDSLEDHKDRKWPFEKVPDVETASLSVILVISSRRILNGIRRGIMRFQVSTELKVSFLRLDVTLN